MPEFEPKKKIRYRHIVCPHCGNDISAKGITDEQKCLFCKRKFKIVFSGHGKKTHWEPVAIDYNYEQMRFAGF